MFVEDLRKRDSVPKAHQAQTKFQFIVDSGHQRLERVHT